VACRHGATQAPPNRFDLIDLSRDAFSGARRRFAA
jgi:hypothetical protein